MTTNQDFLDAAKTFSVTDEMTAEMGARFGVKRFKHHSQSTYYTKVLAAVEADRAREVDAAVKAQEEQDRKDAMARRAAERVDFDAWAVAVRADRDHPEYQLLVAVNRAKAGLEAWEKEQVAFLKRFAESPSYALSWSGSTFEAAADRDVSKWVVSGFEMGCTLEVLTDEALRNVLRLAKTGNSRSTSTVSNLVDDETCQAWAWAYERLSGPTFW